MFRTVIVFVFVGLLFVSCDNSAGKGEVKVPYGSQSRNVAHRIAYSANNGSYSNSYIGRVVGSKEFNGNIYSRYLLSDLDVDADPDVNPVGTELLVDPFPIGKDGRMTLVSIDDFGTIAGSFDPPLSIDIKSEEGDPQNIETVYTGTIPGFEGVKTVSIGGSYTIESKDATVQTNIGTVEGCVHIKIKGTATGDALPVIIKGIPLEGEVWYNETYGVVKARLPQLGIEGNLEETWDIDDPDGEYRTIKKTGIVNDAKTHWKLSTYDMSGDFDADKNTHAKMLLELRWADEELAKSDQRIDTHPAVRVSFETIFGYFPHMLAESPVSIFHPEDNGKGYKFYYAYVDQAAKNVPGDDGVVYEINVRTTDPDVTPDIKATGRIYYRSVK